MPDGASGAVAGAALALRAYTATTAPSATKTDMSVTAAQVVPDFIVPGA